MAKVVTMGEIMLRLSTPNNEKFIQADEFDINYGGGEANVAVSLANYGHDGVKEIQCGHQAYCQKRRAFGHLLSGNRFGNEGFQRGL